MSDELIICIPGPWKNHTELNIAIVKSTDGEFMMADKFLMHPTGKDHVEIEFHEPDGQIANAFRIAGQGSLNDETLKATKHSKGVVFIFFPLDILSQRTRLEKYTNVMIRAGGIAVKLENTGIAHSSERWFSLLRSEDTFDLYTLCVTLVGDRKHYYSCGMHNFRLPDAQIPTDLDTGQAAALLNQFNDYQIAERPRLNSGETFSLTADGPVFRLRLIADERHPPDDLFHNPRRIWNLTRV